MRATIFNIQRFSLHDGSGIRTLVFFKGCPLACRWCSNPESQSPHPQLLYAEPLCIRCGACAAVCPLGAITVKETSHAVRRELCDACGLCAAACPSGALRIAGERKTVDELLRSVLKDRLFYQHSDGGITLSGGEPLMQGEFCRAFLERLKQNGIHTAVETCGFISKDTLESVVPLVDQFLFDFKLHNRERHAVQTGVDNAPILWNLRRLAASGADIVLRLPLIPTVNMDHSHYKGVAAVVNELSLKTVELLPLHHYGKGKYKELGLSYPLPDISPPSSEQVDEVRDFFRKNTQAVIL